MNELDFLEALNDIEDDLILDAKKPVGRKPPIPSILAKIAVAAAILCMLSITVMAVSFSVGILRSEDRVPIHEFYFGGIFSPTSKVTTVEYELQTQEISLPSQWIHSLTEAWETFDYDHSYFKGVDLKTSTGSRINYGGIHQLELLLNMDLVSSPEIEETVRGSFVTLVITDPRRATEEYNREGQITPDGLVIYLPFRTGGGNGLSPETVQYCGINIYVPVTESFADSYRSHVVLSGVGDQDLKESKHCSQGGIEAIFLANTPGTAEEPLRAFAAWEREGIGYLLELKTRASTTTDPAQVILPYLTNLK